MAMSVSSAAVRDQLAADFVDAWDAKAIYWDTPKTPLTDAEFDGISDSTTAARVVCIPQNLGPKPGEGQAGFGQAEIAVMCRIAAVFQYPASGSLQDAKETVADALITDYLTAADTYADGRRKIVDVRWNEMAETEQTRAYFEIEIDFEWRGTTGS